MDFLGTIIAYHLVLVSELFRKLILGSITKLLQENKVSKPSLAHLNVCLIA